MMDNPRTKLDIQLKILYNIIFFRYDGGIKVTLRKHTEKLALTANDSKLFLCLIMDNCYYY